LIFILLNISLIDSSSSSLCSTPNDHSLARALFDMNSMFINIGLGRRVPTPIDSSSASTPQHQPVILRSTNEIVTRKSPSITTKQYKRTNSSSITDDSEQTTGFININYPTRPSRSPARPNSLILSSLSSQKNPIENEQLTDDDNEKYYSAQSSKISTPMIHSMDLSSCLRNSEENLILSSILDIDNEEQKLPQIKIL